MDKKENHNNEFYCPPHIQWTFGDKKTITSVEAKSSEIKIRLNTTEEIRCNSFDHEIYGALKAVIKRSENKKIALFHGGGRKSEILFHCLLEMGCAFEVFFLNIWNLNNENLDKWVLPLAQKSKIKTHVIEVFKTEFYKFSKKTFLSIGVESPEALAMAYLASVIPKEFFPLVGAGSLDRIGPIYEHIRENSSRDIGITNSIPFAAFHVFPYQWQHKNNFLGELAFFQSNLQLMKSALSESKHTYNSAQLDLSDIYYKFFPYLTHRPYASNWSGVVGNEDNLLLRKSLERLAHITPGYQFWKKLSGCEVDVSCLL